MLSGAFHYDPINGLDSNNGILVGETGSGTTFNGTAGTGARQTFGQYATDMDAGRYSPGDTVYIHPPGFTFTDYVVHRSNSTVTDANNKLIIRSLPGQRDNTVLDTYANDETVMKTPTGAHGPIYFLTANFRLQGFVVRHQQQPISAGSGSGFGGEIASHGLEFIDLVGDQQGSAYRNDNAGFIYLNGTSEDFLVRGVRTSNTGLNGNNGLIYYINTLRGTIEYCDLTMSTTGACIHHKRSLGIVAAGDITIRNNFLKSSSNRGTFHAAGTARHLLQNNVHSMSSGGFITWGDSGGVGNTDPPLYQMQFVHETFAGGAQVTLNPAHAEANLAANEGYEIYQRSCIFAGKWYFWARTDNSPNWSNGARDTGLDSNYNHFNGTAALRYFQYLSSVPDITLATWQANATGDTGQDANSVSEAIQYATTPSDSDVTTFRLDAGSAGINAGHDGTDMGADVNDVGPSAIGF